MMTVILFVLCFALPLAAGFFLGRNHRRWDTYNERDAGTWWKEGR